MVTTNAEAISEALQVDLIQPLLSEDEEETV